jgi:hypothetical protein
MFLFTICIVKLLQFTNRGVDGKMDCWEMRWDQLVLCSEVLGRGVFGEVRKGAWFISNQLD